MDSASVPVFNFSLLPRLKKNIVCFRFPTDPIKTCATQIYFMDFQKKKKKKKIFFFFFRKSIS